MNRKLNYIICFALFLLNILLFSNVFLNKDHLVIDKEIVIMETLEVGRKVHFSDFDYTFLNKEV